MSDHFDLSGQVRILLTSDDLEQLRRFYADELGFLVVSTFPNDEGMLLRLVGDVLIELLPGALPTTTQRLSVQVTSVDETYRQLARVAGTAPVLQPWGHRSFDVSDPQGNVLTFFEEVS